MRTVYKYKLVDGPIKVPGRGRILCVQLQNDEPFMWVQQESDAELNDFNLYQVGTGHSIPRESFYVGTTQDGPFVWHWYMEEA